MMHRSIATVSLRGRLEDKLGAIAKAGFDGIELFDNDLISSELAPADVAAVCADLGLAIDLYQPVRDVEDVTPEAFATVERRLRHKFSVASALGAPVVLVCSNVSSAALGDAGVRAEQLHRVGELAADYGISVAYEALAWGSRVNTLAQAWEAVCCADHEALLVAVDTFHMLARGEGPEVLDRVPGSRIGFLQVADAPRLEMNLIEWSRHHRCFPGQGAFDVAGIVSAVLERGYRGPVSLEVFSDVVREVPAEVTATDAMRSLVFLDDQLTGTLPAPIRAVPAFLEFFVPPQDGRVAGLLRQVGFVERGRHRTKPVTWWQAGEASILTNEQQVERSGPRAIGLVTDSLEAVQGRASALRWPRPRRVRNEQETLLPGITAPSGVHLFFSAQPGDEDYWRRDFEVTDETGAPPNLRFDHVGIDVDPHRVDEEVFLYRSMMGLAPSPRQEFIQPDGRLQSMILGAAGRELAIVLNVSHVAASNARPHGITQVALACEDVFETAAEMRRQGLELMPVPENYYADLAARLELPDELLDRLRGSQLLYDADGHGGELVHAYTAVQLGQFFFEILERRGGYEGYGTANTGVRLAFQYSSVERQ